MLMRSFLQKIMVFGTLLFFLHCGRKTQTIDSDPRVTKQIASTLLQAAAKTSVQNGQTDTLPPGFSSDLSVSEIGSTGFKMNWERGSDLSTTQKNLEYRIVYTENAALINATSANEALPDKVTLLKDWSEDLTQAALSDLKPATSYFVAILVRDRAHNIAILGPRSISTNHANAPTAGTTTAFTQTTSSAVQLSWGAAKDSSTESAKLMYRIVKSTTSTDIDSLEEIISDVLGPNVTLVRDWTENLTSIIADGLTGGTTIYFSVAVRDSENNYGIYPPTAMQTASEAISLPTEITTISVTTGSSIEIAWHQATNSQDPSEVMQYKLVKAAAGSSIDSIIEIEAIAGDDVLLDWTAGVRKADVSGLREDVPTYFGILVRDSKNNHAIYNQVSYAPTITTPTATPTAVASATPAAAPTEVATAAPTAVPTATDSTPPIVILSTNAPSPTNTNPISFTATFSENVSVFESSDISVTNGLVSATSGSGFSYGFTVIPLGLGEVTVTIGTNKVQDAAGNNNAASNTLSVVFDSLRPSVTASTLAAEPFNSSSILISATFSKSVTGFTSGDLSPVNANVTNFSGSGTTYSITLTPISNGPVSVSVPAGSAVDEAGNTNTASINISRTYDTVAPSVAITTTENSNYVNIAGNDASFPVSGTCSEATKLVTIKVASVTKGSGATCDGTNFTASIDATNDLSLGANSLSATISDAAGNSTTSALFTVTKDLTAPSIAITTTENGNYVNIANNDASFPVSGTCNEPGLTVRVQVGGINKGSGVTCDGTNFIASIDAINDLVPGVNTLTAIVADSAGNSTTSVSFNVTKDITAPNVAITSPTEGNHITVANNYTVSGTCNENGKLVTIKVDTVANGAGATCNGTTFSANISTGGISATSHAFTAVISDTAGNSTTSTTVNLKFPLNISLAGYTNLNVTGAWLNSTYGWNITTGPSVIITNTATITSNSTGTAALIFNVVMPSGSTLSFINNAGAYVIGRGGDGGQGGQINTNGNKGYNGSPGGIAILASTPVTIINNGTIGGGGGGGGGGRPYGGGGGGGGGGANYGSGASPGGEDAGSGYPLQAGAGASAGATSPGNGGIGGAYNGSAGSTAGPANGGTGGVYGGGGGGQGGALGASGGWGGECGSGAPAKPSGGAGGAPGAGGAATSGNVNISWPGATGTRSGSLL